MSVFDPLRDDPRLADVSDRLASDEDRPLIVDGLWGSSAPIVAGLAAERLERPLLYITAHSDEADDARDDLETLLGATPALFPALETLPGEQAADDELAGERVRLCVELLRTRDDRDGAYAPRVIIAPVQALMQPVPAADAIREHSFSLYASQQLDPDALIDWLVDHGFAKCDQVETPGDFARRGGIVDVYPPGMGRPLRIEFFGDEVDSLRIFEAGTQRSSDQVDAAEIPAMSLAAGRTTAVAKSGGTASLLSYLPQDAIVAVHKPTEIQEIGRTFWQRLGERAGLINVDGVFRRAADFPQLHLYRFATGGSDINLEVGSLPQFEAKGAEALKGLAELASGDTEAIVLCDNPAEQKRFNELLDGAEEDVSNVRTAVGVLHRGFRWNATAYVPHHELFQRYARRRTLRKIQPARPIDSFYDLNPGDLVVHVQHGIGKFLGLKPLERDGRKGEYLALEFADQAIIHVPVSQVHVVQKYIGAQRGRVSLSKIGGTAWKRTKQRVSESVTDLAAELLAIQAERQGERGVSFPHDTEWQREFEESFIYTETEDQLRALNELKGDMTQPRPMDRLLCGDVGFGKTELAIRAAFKAVEYGKQVAVLVPTTVLAEQHHQTFAERMADYPFRIEALSRYRTAPEQKKILERTRKGEIDVLIGTHRILSKDVRFADLGLVIIDEEQRFGVESKERLKQLRATVDVLTLSATPIPRTLHLALLGIRDISSLSTPPIDRRAIVTSVRMWDDRLIRDAILRELNRDGQVYFVHNFVRDIHDVANNIRTVVPEANVVVGHGQMKGAELEQVMLQFMRREADVLVATNIIESGLDIPTANTMFINRAERFGLADLHQLRGRVGRSSHRAYAYMLLSPKHPVKENAARRLKAIEHYSELGAGFQIAMRDLEIRGAGNILGPEQSGHIEAVGYELYCQLLEQAARRLRNEPAEIWRPVNLDLGISAAIPRRYIPTDRQRMEVYKRLANSRSMADVESLRNDVRDAFGPLPGEVETLLLLAEIRVLSQPWGIRSIVLDEPDLVFSIDDLKTVEPLFAEGPGSPRIPDPQTIHWRLPKRHLQPDRICQILRNQLSRQAPETAAVS